MENKRIFGKICYVHRQLLRENVKVFQEYGVTPVQLHALTFINKRRDAGEFVCQKDLEKQINLRASSISTLITNLERDGFVVRTVSGGDARTKYLDLTEKGRQVCLKDKMLMDSCDGAIAASLTEEEQEELLKLLNKIIDNNAK